MYEYILRYIRLVSWTFDKVICAKFPLEQIDTIDAIGNINRNSAMFQIIYGVRILSLTTSKFNNIHIIVHMQNLESKYLIRILNLLKGKPPISYPYIV